MASSDYEKRRADIREFNADSKVLKRGIAITPVKFGISFTSTILNQAGALVHVYKDGTVQLNHGGTEMGQGLYIKVEQVVADELGIGIEKIRITAADTSKVPNASATAASSGADMNGKAAQKAAAKIRKRLTAFAAHKYGVSEAEVDFRGGKVIRRRSHHGVSRSSRISPGSIAFHCLPRASIARRRFTTIARHSPAGRSTTMRTERR